MPFIYKHVNLFKNKALNYVFITWFKNSALNHAWDMIFLTFNYYWKQSSVDSHQNPILFYTNSCTFLIFLGRTSVDQMILNVQDQHR